MLTVQITGIDELKRELEDFSDRRFNAAVATALTRAARRLANEWQRDLESTFDRPTPATTRAVEVKMANANNLEAEVRIKDQAGNASPAGWIAPHERGGSRLVKKFEAALQSAGAMARGAYAVPGPAAKLDAYGNVSRGQIVQVLNQLGGGLSPGYRRVIGATASKRAASAAAKRRKYVAFPTREGRRPAGVYERQASGRLVAVFWFVPRATYQRRLSLIERAQAEGAELLGAELERAIGESAARLAARGG